MAQAQVSLKSYCDEVRDLVNKGAYDEALVTGRYILQHYPKYVEAYHLLAQACLGKGQYDEASDLFARVLSVDPENVSARTGMSKLFEAKGDVASAGLQMREAFDLAPSQAGIRSELHRLLRLQGGEPSRLKLTRQGLGRIYLRGGLYTQAADEFETLLREDPDQIDVEVSLAEALWRDGQLIRSVEVCQSALNKLPYCLKTNLILAETWMRSDREDEGETHLQRVRMVDPEGELAYQLLGESTLIPRVSVMLTRMGAAPAAIPQAAEAPETVETEEIPAWLREAAPPHAGTVEDLALPAAAAIVMGATATVAASAPPKDDAALPPAEESAALETSDLPDWLKKVRVEELAAEGKGPATPTGAQPADSAAEAWTEPNRIAGEPAAPAEAELKAMAPAKLPSWLTEAAPPGALSPTAATPEEVVTGELPSWLAEAEEETAADVDASEETPSWLSESEPEIADHAAAPETLEAGELPSWLSEAAPGDGALTAAASLAAEGGPVNSAEGEAETADLVTEEPDWLRALKAEHDVSAVPTAIESDEVEALPSWLADTAAAEQSQAIASSESTAVAGAPAESVEPGTEEEEPAWRRILREEGLEAELPTEQDIAAAQAPSAAAPEELGDLTDVLDEDAIPSWLRDAWAAENAAAPATAEAFIAPETVEAPPTAGAKPAEDVPGWPQERVPAAGEAQPEAAPPSAAAPVDAEEEIPDWLRLLREEGLESELPSEEELAAAGLMAETEAPAAHLEPAALSPVEEEPVETPAGPEPSWMRILRGQEMDLVSEEHLEEAGLMPETATEAEPAAAEPEAEEIPAWLRQAAIDEGLVEMTATPATAVTETPAAPPMETAAPAKAAPPPETPIPFAAEEKAPTPITDWLNALRADGLAEAILPEGPAEPVVQTTAIAAEPTPGSEQALPIWMRMLREAREEVKPEDEMQAADLAEPEPGPDSGQPLVDSQTTAARVVAPPPTEIAPDWFAELRQEAAAGEEAGDVVEATAVETSAEAQIDAAIITGYENAVENNPKDYLTRWKLIQAHASSGNHDAAVAHSQKLLEANELVSEVADYLKSAVDSGVQTRQAYQLLGDAHFKGGRLEEALDAYRKALSLLY